MSTNDHCAGASDAHARPETFTVKEKIDTKNSSPEDQKPRIVLTFRSDKAGLKNSSMKIVSSEEKYDKTSQDSFEDSNETSPKKKQAASESDESAEASTPKRSARCRTKEYSDSVLANAIARKEKSYSETTLLSQRPSRRIKPTAKVLANKELRVEIENNIGIKVKSEEKSPEEGVQTRRSLRRRSVDHTSDDITVTEISPKKHKHEEKISGSHDRESKKLNKMKKKHLSKLGLKAKEENTKEDESTMDSVNTESLNEHLNANKLVDSEWEDSKTLEISEDDEEVEETADSVVTSDEDCVIVSHKKGSGEQSRRSTRQSNRDVNTSAQNSSGAKRTRTPSPPPASAIHRPSSSRRALIFENLMRQRVRQPSNEAEPRRREEEPRVERPRRACSTRTRLRLSWQEQNNDYYISKHTLVKTFEDNVDDEPPQGDEGEEAACPDDDDSDEIIATCTCEEPGNMYPAPEDGEKDVLFCGAVESVESVRVGCSLTATGALGRAGPRAPWLPLCTLHRAQLRRHMACSTCGVFCTQGIFYQCSKGHLFHLECGIPPTDKGPPGCPHCGHSLRYWTLGNRECWKVKVTANSDKPVVFTTEQKASVAAAYLGFPSTSLQEPVIPPDLLPSPPIDLKKMLAKNTDTAATTEDALDNLIEAIINHDPTEQLICKLAGIKVNKPIEEANGGTLAHLAAKWGNLTAVYLLQYAGANLDVTDAHLRTPLMVAVLALLEKPDTKSKAKSTAMEVDEKEAVDSKSDKDAQCMDDVKSGGESEAERAKSEERFMKVIRYLVAAGCDVNFPGPEGMTALHLAAQLGGAAACDALLAAAAADVDARDHGGWTPLVWAAENDHPDVVRVLVRRGALCDARDAEGNSALHWVALAGHARVLSLLLARAHPDLGNAHADTPLHVAARQGHYSCVVILLAHGARTDMENSAGELAVEVCGARGGRVQAAISLRMQMQLALQDARAPYRLLSSDISKGRERYPVPCINEKDDAPLPEFRYVTQHVITSQINIDNSLATTEGCACVGSCGSGAGGGEGAGAGGGEGAGVSECACMALCVRRWARGGRLLPRFPHHEPAMLFECNQTCGCDLRKCENRMVSRLAEQGAMLARAQVFRAGGSRGWGLRAAGAVPRGSPVALYVGELLTVRDADARPKDHYMFALDLKQDLLEQCKEKTQLCVDALTFGSAARFINHSCRPNLAPVRVFTHCRDLRLPLVTLFATKDIAAYEEFTFDYGDKFWSVKRKQMKCECGTPECRYPTIDNED